MGGGEHERPGHAEESQNYKGNRVQLHLARGLEAFTSAMPHDDGGKAMEPFSSQLVQGTACYWRG
jgi:hypothetical protein